MNNFLYNHQERLKQLQLKDGSTDKDTERTALFYILAGNDDLYSKVEYIYDFKERIITPECLENGKVDFCSSSRKLIKLAYNLFNGYPADVLDTFYILDNNNFDLALNALKIRFNKHDGTYID
ncbi:MAG: hypothetical protein GX309_13300 [Clostridiales bacterium]|jgi:hypothetical protein|nr:hypothetical protein [Clostridiales bacterium]